MRTYSGEMLSHTPSVVTCFLIQSFIHFCCALCLKQKLSLSSDNVPVELDAIADLCDDLVSGKTTMQEVESSAELQALQMKLGLSTYEHCKRCYYVNIYTKSLYVYLTSGHLPCFTQCNYFVFSVSGFWRDVQKNTDVIRFGNSHGVISDVTDEDTLGARQ